MTRYSPFHKIIPERVEVLNNIKEKSLNHYKTHFSTSYAKRKLSFISYVINPNLQKTILITAGCHGNEPAPIYAVRNFLAKRPQLKDKRIVIVPCMNPYGFCLNSERNIHRININRDFFSKKPQQETKIMKQLIKKYKPVFVLNLHEDPDEECFFLYSEGKYREIAEKLISLLSKKIKYYKRKKVHQDWAINGIIESAENNGSFEDYLTYLGIPNFCTETPGIYSLEKRIKVNEAIIRFVLEQF